MSVDVKTRRSSSVRKIARHRVRKSIEQMIVNGRFRPGEKLVQLQLSRQFGVSLGMIREALFELEGLGLVESFDNRGVHVRSLDSQAIHELQVIREVFDGVAVRECCGKLKPTDADELRQLAERIYLLTTAGAFEEKNLLDRQFHLRIAELSGNRMLVGLARQHQVMGKVWGQTINAQRTREEHLAIIEAIVANDPDRAEAIARRHLRHASLEMPKEDAARAS